MLISRLVEAAVFLAVGAILGSAQVPDGLRSAVGGNHAYDVVSNIVYKVANNYELRLDVYHPHAVPGPIPVVMMIHGGDWISGSKDDYIHYAGSYIATGFAVVNVECRLGKVSLAPAAVKDCQRAPRWIGVGAKQYNFDLEKMVVTGTSAGGPLAPATGMIPASTGANECANMIPPNDAGPKLTAIINICGITDVADLLQGPKLRTCVASWLGGQPNQEDLASRLSPLTYARSGGPAELTIHSDADPTVPYSHAVRLHEVLSEAGVRDQWMTVQGGGHGGFTAEQDILAFRTTRSFLESLGIRAISH